MGGAASMTGVVALAGALAVGLAAAGAAAVEAQRVSGVADASALAAADVLSGFAAGEPCERARQVADAQGAEIASCAVAGRDATIEVSGAFGSIPIRVAARAGPPRDVPDPDG